MDGSNKFSAQFIKVISHYKKIGYNVNVLQQTACLVVNPITVGNFAFLFNWTPMCYFCLVLLCFRARLFVGELRSADLLAFVYDV